MKNFLKISFFLGGFLALVESKSPREFQKENPHFTKKEEKRFYKFIQQSTKIKKDIKYLEKSTFNDTQKKELGNFVELQYQVDYLLKKNPHFIEQIQFKGFSDFHDHIIHLLQQGFKPEEILVFSNLECVFLQPSKNNDEMSYEGKEILRFFLDHDINFFLCSSHECFEETLLYTYGFAEKSSESFKEKLLGGPMEEGRILLWDKTLAYEKKGKVLFVEEKIDHDQLSEHPFRELVMREAMMEFLLSFGSPYQGKKDYYYFTENKYFGALTLEEEIRNTIKVVLFVAQEEIDLYVFNRDIVSLNVFPHLNKCFLCQYNKENPMDIMEKEAYQNKKLDKILKKYPEEISTQEKEMFDIFKLARDAYFFEMITEEQKAIEVSEKKKDSLLKNFFDKPKPQDQEEKNLPRFMQHGFQPLPQQKEKNPKMKKEENLQPQSIRKAPEQETKKEEKSINSDTKNNQINYLSTEDLEDIADFKETIEKKIIETTMKEKNKEEKRIINIKNIPSKIFLNDEEEIEIEKYILKNKDDSVDLFDTYKEQLLFNEDYLQDGKIYKKNFRKREREKKHRLCFSDGEELNIPFLDMDLDNEEAFSQRNVDIKNIECFFQKENQELSQNISYDDSYDDKKPSPHKDSQENSRHHSPRHSSLHSPKKPLKEGELTSGTFISSSTPQIILNDNYFTAPFQQEGGFPLFLSPQEQTNNNKNEEKNTPKHNIQGAVKKIDKTETDDEFDSRLTFRNNMSNNFVTHDILYQEKNSMSQPQELEKKSSFHQNGFLKHCEEEKKDNLQQNFEKNHMIEKNFLKRKKSFMENDDDENYLMSIIKEAYVKIKKKK